MASERTAGGSPASSEGTSTTADEREIRTIIDRYARSVDTLDTNRAAEFWLTTAEASFIHPRGHERGWESIKRNFYEGTMGRFSERTLAIHAVAIHVLGDLAWAEFYWDFQARFHDGMPLTTQGRETQVYTRTDHGWKLVHVHYSGPAATGLREGF